MERDAIKYSDGSFNVFPLGFPLERIGEIRDMDNANIKDATQLATVVRVRVEMIETKEGIDGDRVLSRL